MKITVVQGDITKQDVNAIVNAARPSLEGGGGVDGAIHRAAGDDLYDACVAIPCIPERLVDEATRTITGGRDVGRDDVRCNVGEARATPAFDLPARFVIHTVGPIFDPLPEMEDYLGLLLESAYVESLRLAQMLGCRTVALPAISCGVYGYPLDKAASIAILAAARPEWYFDEVRFVLFPDDAKAAFDAALARHAPTQ